MGHYYGELAIFWDKDNKMYLEQTKEERDIMAREVAMAYIQGESRARKPTKEIV